MQHTKRLGQNKMVDCLCRGSITLEVSVCIVSAAFFMFFIISIIQYVYAYHLVNRSTVAVAQRFSCYSSVLHESGLSSFSDNIKKRLLKKTGAYDNGAVEPLITVADLAFSSIDDSLYNSLIKDMITNDIEQRSPFFDIETVSLNGSKYFYSDNKFELNVRFRIKTLFPIEMINVEGYDIVVNVKGACWTDGAVSEYDINDIKVWELDNLRRGRVLERVFGSNLPESFPLIDIYSKEEKYVAVIESIDHTKKTYMKRNEMTKVISKIVNKLDSFKSTTYDGVTVSEKDYINKKIILVMPKNPMTTIQMEEVTRAVTNAAMKGITISLEYYQISKPS